MQSGVAVKTNGPHPPSDRLRLRIVEMAGKRSRNGSGDRSIRIPPTPVLLHSRESNIDISKLENLKTVEREIKGEVYRPMLISRVGQNKECINLNVPKTPKPRKEQQALSPYHRVVVLDAGSHNCNNNNNSNNNGISNKDKASARLLRRFRQRRLLNGEEMVEATNDNEGLYDKILPSQYHRAFTAAEPSKRFRAPSGTVIDKPISKEVVYTLNRNDHSITPEGEADTSSLSPTTHFPSNESAGPKQQRGAETNKHALEGRQGQADSASRRQEPKSTLITKEKQENLIRLSELRGNALTTPPPRQNSNRKPGLFSASLDAFKRRLRQTANKYSNRLNNEIVDRTEEYVIRPEPQVTKTGNGDQQFPSKPRYRLQFPRFEPQRQIFQQGPSSDTRRINPKLRQPNSQNTTGKNMENKNQSHSNKEVYTLVGSTKNSCQDASPYDDGKYISESNNNGTAQMSRNLKNNDHSNIDADKEDDFTRVETARKSSTFTICSDKNGILKLKSQNFLGVKEILADGDGASTDMDSDTLPCVTSIKQPVPKVKTYVVINTQKLTNGIQASQVAPQPPPRRVAPLTEHNMRLHESLMAMYERRAQRMARYQKRQKALQLQQDQEQQQQENRPMPTQQRQENLQVQRHYQLQIAKENAGDFESYADHSEESASDKRIRKWIMDVSEQFAFPLQEEAIGVSVDYLTQPDLAVESAIQFENPLSSRGVACY